MSHRSPWLFRLFRRYTKGYLARHFHAVRLSKSGFLPDAGTPGPILVAVNHPSWWDPLVGLVLCERMGERSHHAPIDAKGLARYPFLGRLGFFGVEPDSARGGLTFLRQGMKVLESPDAVLWVTAEGRFADVRERAALKEGMGHLARRLKSGCVLPMALEYPFWDERTPEALARFGPPIALTGEGTSAEWSGRIAEALGATMDALAADAISRDPSRFESVVTGRVGVGGVYDGWRRLKAALRGEAFAPGHGETSPKD